MNASRWATTSALAALAACGGTKTPAADVAAKPDSLAKIEFKQVTTHPAKNDSTVDKCPSVMIFEATAVGTHLSGTLRYQWMRSDGSHSDTMTTEVPSAAKAGSAEFALTADRWTDTTIGVLLTLSNRVHVIAPIEQTSPPVDFQIRCTK